MQKLTSLLLFGVILSTGCSSEYWDRKNAERQAERKYIERREAKIELENQLERGRIMQEYYGNE